MVKGMRAVLLHLLQAAGCRLGVAGGALQLAARVAGGVLSGSRSFVDTGLGLRGFT